MSLRVLVTDGHANAAVATVRSLGRAGHEPYVAVQRGAFGLAAHSTYCRGRVAVPDPMAAPDDYAAALLAATAELGIDAVMPISDPTLVACGPHREQLAARATYCAAPEAALRAAGDKWAVLAAARAAGLAVPEAGLVTAGHDPARCDLPHGGRLVVRARRSISRHGTGLVKPAGRVVSDQAGLRAAVESIHAVGGDAVVSRFLEGTGRGVYLLAGEERTGPAFGHLRERARTLAGVPRARWDRFSRLGNHAW